MDNFMMIAIVPLGYAEKVIESAHEAGATGATIFRARGLGQSAKEGLFSFKVEPEEDVVMITATQEVIDAICSRIHDEFIQNCKRSGSIYILPVQCVEDDVQAE